MVKFGDLADIISVQKSLLVRSGWIGSTLYAGNLVRGCDIGNYQKFVDEHENWSVCFVGSHGDTLVIHIQEER